MLCVNCCHFHLNEFLYAIALVYLFFKLPHFHYYILPHVPLFVMLSSLTLLYFYFSSYYLLIDSIAAINVHFNYFFCS